MLSQRFWNKFHTVDSTPLAFRVPLAHGRGCYSKNAQHEYEAVNMDWTATRNDTASRFDGAYLDQNRYGSSCSELQKLATDMVLTAPNRKSAFTDAIAVDHMRALTLRATATNTTIGQLPEDRRLLDPGEDFEFEFEDESPPTAPRYYDRIRHIVHVYRKICHLDSMPNLRPAYLVLDYINSTITKSNTIRAVDKQTELIEPGEWYQFLRFVSSRGELFS